MAAHTPSAVLADPTLDHYLPMIYATALQSEGEAVTLGQRGGLP